MRQLVDSTQIDQWFTSLRRDAQEVLPHLIRRLILETVSPDQLEFIRIPVLSTQSRNVRFSAK